MNNNRQIKLFHLLHFFMLSCVFPVPQTVSAEETIEVSFLNTNEGEAIFFKDNANTILIDAGPPVIQQSVLDKVRGNPVSVIITHPHPDHYGGIFYLQGITRIKEIFDNGESLTRMPEGSEYAAWYEQIVRNHSAYQVLRKGDTPFSNDHMSMEVLWPPSISDDRDYNENSLVLLLTIFKKKILLMGDVPISIEKIMLMENLLPKDIDVLKVGHHGAEDAASEEFLVRISPRYAIITGSGNMRHPYQHPDTLKRLEKYSKRVFITHQTGTIMYTVNSKGEDYIGTH